MNFDGSFTHPTLDVRIIEVICGELRLQNEQSESREPNEGKVSLLLHRGYKKKFFLRTETLFCCFRHL